MIEYKNLSNKEKEELLHRVYETGVKYETENGCCSQCVIATIMNVFEIEMSQAFKASYGMGGGAGLSSRGTCGAVNGGIMVISHITGRSFHEFSSGKNLKCYELSRRFMEEFNQKYDSILCGDVQTKIMGKSFDLAVQEEYDDFIKLGGHYDKCPEVIGYAARIVARIIIDGSLD